MAQWRDVRAVERALDALGELARPDDPLGARTTYRVGGPAAVLVSVGREADLAAVADARAASGLPVLVVGKGSNLLIADRGFEGIAIALDDSFASLEISGSDVSAGGALALPILARQTANAGLSGLEWMVGVPGSVGGAVRMNAGGHGSDVAASLQKALVYDLDLNKTVEMSAQSLDFGYRSSSVAASQIVVSATFQTQPDAPERSLLLISEIVQWRRANQPGGQNAGSVFVNPDGVSAGEQIDRLGLKGTRIGTAEVSRKHANFIQADEGGTAADVSNLMDHVAGVVEREAGLRLHTEIRRIGFGDRESDVR